MAFSPIASLGFFFRNVDKVDGGEYGRIPVAVGQFNTVFKAVKDYDKSIAKGTDAALSIFREAVNNPNALKRTGKVLGFLSEHVNGFIVASSAIQVMRAEDKEREVCIQAPMLGLMFLGEGICKRNYAKVANSATVKNAITKMSKTKVLGKVYNTIMKRNWGGKVGNIIRGITFLAFSIGFSTVGSKIGHNIADKIDSRKEQSMLKEASQNSELRMAA